MLQLVCARSQHTTPWHDRTIIEAPCVRRETYRCSDRPVRRFRTAQLRPSPADHPRGTIQVCASADCAAVGADVAIDRMPIAVANLTVTYSTKSPSGGTRATTVNLEGLFEICQGWLACLVGAQQQLMQTIIQAAESEEATSSSSSLGGNQTISAAEVPTGSISRGGAPPITAEMESEGHS